MPAEFTLGVGPFPAGTTVGVYTRRTVFGDAGPVGGVPVVTAVTSSLLTTVFTGLAFDTEYWAAAVVGAVWRRVAFMTDRDPLLTGSVTSVAGRSGAVSLVKADVGLGVVDNTTDVAKPVSTAAQAAIDADRVRLTSLESTRALKANLAINVKDYGATGDGTTDDNTAIQAAITALPANGGTLIFPFGDYRMSGRMLFGGKRSVVVKGYGGLSSGATTASRITYTGTVSPFIDAIASDGVVFEDLQIVYSNASFVGTIIDWTGGAGETAYGGMTRCFVGGLGVRTATRLVKLDKATIMGFRDTIFAGAAVAVEGMAASSYSNNITFTGCTFKDLTSMAVLACGEAWSFHSCAFQNLVTSGGAVAGAGGISCSVAGASTKAPKGVAVIGCWFGDATVAGTWILVKGTGWLIAGNAIGGGSIGVNTRSTDTQGITIVGNRFDVVANAVTVSNTQSNLVVVGNDWFNCTVGLAYTSTPAASIMQDGGIGASAFIDLFGVLRTVAGAVTDGNFPAVPPNGTFGLDSTNSRLYVRVGGVWKYAALT